MDIFVASLLEFMLGKEYKKLSVYGSNEYKAMQAALNI